MSALLVTWAALAIYYSNLPWGALRLALAVAFLAFAIWAVFWRRNRRKSAAFGLVYLGVVA